MNTIDIHGLKEVWGQDTVIVNVLARDAFDEDRIPGSISIPLADIEAIAPKVLGKGQHIVTYCANEKCAASTDAAKKLLALGYTHVYDYKEGIAGWNERIAACEHDCCCGDEECEDDDCDCEHGEEGSSECCKDGEGHGKKDGCCKDKHGEKGGCCKDGEKSSDCHSHEKKSCCKDGDGHDKKEGCCKDGDGHKKECGCKNGEKPHKAHEDDDGN